MELTKEYFDEQNKVTKEHFDKESEVMREEFRISREHFDQQLGEKLKGFVTKEYFDEQNKTLKEEFKTSREHLEQKIDEQSKDLKAYTQEVADVIIEAMDNRFNQTDAKIEKIEKRLVGFNFRLTNVETEIGSFRPGFSVADKRKPQE